MGVIERSGLYGPKERYGESATEVQGPCAESLSHTTLRHHLPRIEPSYSYSTSLGTALAHPPTTVGTTQLNLSPAGRSVCWLHSARMCDVLFFWRNSWQALNH